MTRKKLRKKHKILIGIGVATVASVLVVAPILGVAANPVVSDSSTFNKEKEQTWLNENALSIEVTNPSITPDITKEKKTFSASNQAPNYLEITKLPSDFSSPNEYEITKSVPNEGKVVANIYFSSGASKKSVEISNFLTTTEAVNKLKENIEDIKVYSANPAISYDEEYYKKESSNNDTNQITNNQITNISKESFFGKISKNSNSEIIQNPIILPKDFIISGLPKDIPFSFVKQFISVTGSEKNIKLNFNGFDFPSIQEGIPIEGFKNTGTSYESDLTNLKTMKVNPKTLDLPKNSEISSSGIYIPEESGKDFSDYISFSDQKNSDFIKDNLLLSYLSNISTTSANFNIILKSGAKFTWPNLTFAKLQTNFSSIDDLYSFAKNTLSNLSVKELETDLQNLNVKDGKTTSNGKFLPQSPQSYWSASSSIQKIENSELKVNDKSGLDVSVSYKLKANVDAEAPIVGKSPGTIQIGKDGKSSEFFTTKAKIQPLLIWSEKEPGKESYKIFTYPSIQTLYAGGATKVETILGSFYSSGGNTVLNSKELEKQLPKKGTKISIGYMLTTPDAEEKNLIPNLSSTQTIKASIATTTTNSSQNLTYLSLIQGMLQIKEYDNLEDAQASTSNVSIKSTNPYYTSDKGILQLGQGDLDENGNRKDLYKENSIYFESQNNPYYEDENGKIISKLGSKTFSGYSFTINDSSSEQKQDFYSKEELDSLLNTTRNNINNAGAEKINTYLEKVFKKSNQTKKPQEIGISNPNITNSTNQFILKNDFNIKISDLKLENNKLFAKMDLNGALNYWNYFDSTKANWLTLKELKNVEIEIVPALFAKNGETTISYSGYNTNSILGSVSNKWFDPIEYKNKINNLDKTSEIPEISKDTELKQGFLFKFKNSNESVDNNLFSENLNDTFDKFSGITEIYFSLPLLTLQYTSLEIEENNAITL